MTYPMDPLQQLDEAIVAILDTHAEIVELTERNEGNIVAWETIEEMESPTVPVIAFLRITDRELAADLDPHEALYQFSAIADDKETVSQLLYVITHVLDQPAFAALAVPIDAFAVRRVRNTNSLDVTLRVTAPHPVAV